MGGGGGGGQGCDKLIVKVDTGIVNGISKLPRVWRSPLLSLLSASLNSHLFILGKGGARELSPPETELTTSSHSSLGFRILIKRFLRSVPPGKT